MAFIGSASAVAQSKTATGNQSQYFTALDGMRGFAALCIVWGHSHDMWFPEWHGGGVLIVDMFFVISGFMMAHAYGARVKAGLNLKSFVRNRLIRLYPIMMIGLGLGAAVTFARAWMVGDTEFWRLWASLGFGALGLPSFFVTPGQWAFPFNIAYWALFFILAINIVYAAFGRYLTLARKVIITAVSGLALIAAVIYHGDNSVGWDKTTFLAGVLRTVYGFVAGLLLYDFRPKNIRSIEESKSTILVLIVALVGVIFVPWGMPEWLMTILRYTFLPLLVYAGVSITLGDRLSAACKWIGSVSYALFALHYPIAVILRRITKDLNLPVEMYPVMLAMVFVVTIGASVVLMKYYDEPVRNWLHKQFNKTKAVSTRTSMQPRETHTFNPKSFASNDNKQKPKAESRTGRVAQNDLNE